jgi:hypothetical protein
LTRLFIDLKELIHLSDKTDGSPVLWIEFDRLEELTSVMNPTGHMHHLGATDMIVDRVAITLEDALQAAQEAVSDLPVETFGTGLVVSVVRVVIPF